MTGEVLVGATEFSTAETGGTTFISIIRRGDLSGATSVQYATTSNTAIAGVDFVSTSGTITMQAGVDRVLIPVTINNDTLSEATEDFTFSIINVSSGTLSAPRTAHVSILDDENPVVQPPVPPLQSDFDVQLMPTFQGLNQPISIEFSKTNTNLVYIAEKGGVIKIADLSTGAAPQTILDISSKVNENQDRGLIDIAINPNLAANPYLYAFYVVDPSDTAGKSGNAGPDGGGNRYSYVSRFTLDAASGYKTVVAGSEVVLLGTAGTRLSDISGAGVEDSTSNLTIASSELLANGNYKQDYIKVDSRSHAGGALEFGPDGALYVSTGDGASFNAPDPRAVSVLDVNSLSGKILRINPINGDGLADNPFHVSGTSLDLNVSKVYQLGLRNPFSLSFDKVGQLFISETGWDSYEEVNTGGPGANFGWPYFEGSDGGIINQTNGYSSFPNAAAYYAAVQAGTIKITAPYRAFSHSDGAPGFQVQSIVGAGDVISSNVYPTSMLNDYLFSDFSQGEIYAVDVNDRTELKFLYQSPSGFGPVRYQQGADGYLYYVDIANGAIGRLEIADKGAAAPTLSGTIKAEFFSIAPGVSSLSQINFAANPLFTENVTSISKIVGGANFYSGGPTDNFAARYTASFTVEKTGYYSFYLTSDDGSKLLVDGKSVVNGDGLHSVTEASGSIYLTGGSHSLQVQYFEATGDATLDLDWSGPLFGRQSMNFNGVSQGTVTNDVPNVTQYLTGTTAFETFAINGNSSAYAWGPTLDNSGIVVWGPTGFDILTNYDAIKFNDLTVPLTAAGNQYQDLANVTQYLTGQSNDDTFVINGNRSSYNYNPTGDGQGIVVWGVTGFDLLFSFEKIKFNDQTVDITTLAAGRVVQNTVGVTQYEFGTEFVDTFVINANSSQYNWGPTQDGNDHIVWSGTEFDLLYSWEKIQFNDRVVDLLA